MSETDQGPPGPEEVDPAPPGPSAEPPAAKPGRRRRLIKILAITGAALLVVVLALTGVVAYFAYKYDHNITRIPKVFAVAPGETRPPKVVSKAENFLLVGTDSRASTQTTGTAGNSASVSPIGQRSDTIMLVHLPANRKSAYLVSIPRDSWVPIPGFGTAKVNAALAWGGPRLLRQTIEQLTGVRIDHYLEVDFSGFKAMTDAVGGVDINVPIDSYDSARQKQWHAGMQHLNGTDALLYVRQRYGLPNGDFDRIKHQHQFLQALMSKASHAGMLTDPVALNRLLQAVTKSVSVDSGLSAGALLSLAKTGRSVAGATRFYTVPVTGTGMVGDQSVVFLDAPKDKVLWAAMKNDKLDSYVASTD